MYIGWKYLLTSDKSLADHYNMSGIFLFNTLALPPRVEVGGRGLVMRITAGFNDIPLLARAVFGSTLLHEFEENPALPCLYLFIENI